MYWRIKNERKNKRNFIPYNNSFCLCDANLYSRGVFMKKIITENPVFVLMLGLCSTLAVTTKVENAIIMGICLTIVLILSNTIISILKKLIPESVKIPTYILIIGTMVTILEILLEKYAVQLYNVLGIYLPLIVVNCIVLGRAINVASRESVLNSMKDGFFIGLGYLFSLVVIALIREILGTGYLTIMDLSTSLTGYRMVYQIYEAGNILPLNILQTPAGAFFTLGFISLLFNLRRDKNESN